MNESTADPIAHAIGAFGYLVHRGSSRLNDADQILLAAPIDEQVSWRGGIREDGSGKLIFIEAIDSNELNERDAARLGHLLGAAYVGFYALAAEGIALADVTKVMAWYGESVEANYPEAGPAFLRFATTYWTFKVLIRELDLHQSRSLIRALLVRIDELLGPLFFPYEGPITADPARREADQRRFLLAFGPSIALEDFVARNPILIRDRKKLNKR